MDARTILSKIITLIYRSRQLGNLENDELIKTVLATMKVDSPDFNFLGNNVIKKVKDTCYALLDERECIPKEVLLPQLSILLENDQKLLTSLKDAIDQSYEESTIKRVVTNLVKTLNNFHKEQLALEIISKASYDLKFNRNKIPNFAEYLRQTISELEPMTLMTTTAKDPAVVNEVDFTQPEGIDNLFEEVRKQNNNTGVYKLGWKAMNRMQQGGVRRGEFRGVAALEHRYKSSFTLTDFVEIAILNTPICSEEEIASNKKPLLLRISFEDSLTSNLQFMYQYLKARDGTPIHSKEFEGISSEEMTKYVTKKLTVNGFHVKMRRVDPSQWSYAHLFNYIIELEAQGYAIHVLELDYVTMLPTTGCTQGPTGSDKRDLVRRIRNFTSARNIATITPLQLGPDVKRMVMNGTAEHTLVRDIVGQSLLDGSKAITQELDVLVYIHLFTRKRKKYLAVALDKHRLPTVAPEEDRYFMLKFPSHSIPVLGDEHTDYDTSFQRLPKDYEDGTSDGLLSEVLN